MADILDAVEGYNPESTSFDQYSEDGRPDDGNSWWESGDIESAASALDEGFNALQDELRKHWKAIKKDIEGIEEAINAVSLIPATIIGPLNSVLSASISLGGAKISLAGPLGVVSIGTTGASANFGLGLQGSISAAALLPEGPTKDAVTAKIDTAFGAVLKAKGTSVSAQISAGTAAINAGVSFGSKGVFNLKVGFNGKVTNHAQNIKIVNGGPKPEGQHSIKSNLALNKNKLNAAIAFAVQFGGAGAVKIGTTIGGGAGAVKIGTTIGTNFEAPQIGLSASLGGFKVSGSIPMSYAFEQTKEGGFVLVGTGVPSNTYEPEINELTGLPVGTSTEELRQQLRQQQEKIRRDEIDPVLADLGLGSWDDLETDWEDIGEVGDDEAGTEDDHGADEDQPVCLTYNMKVMLSNNILINVNKLKLGDKLMTNGEPTIVQELIFNHIRKGYYIINGELEITNDHPVLSNGKWKRTEDLLIGDVVNGVRIYTMKYISKRTPTVSIVTAADNYNVYCNENLYTVHGRYKLFLEKTYRSAA